MSHIRLLLGGSGGGGVHGFGLNHVTVKVLPPLHTVAIKADTEHAHQRRPSRHEAEQPSHQVLLLPSNSLGQQPHRCHQVDACRIATNRQRCCCPAAGLRHQRTENGRVPDSSPASWKLLLCPTDTCMSVLQHASPDASKTAHPANPKMGAQIHKDSLSHVGLLGCSWLRPEPCTSNSISG
jgi:hypothetical protein